jgi:hypothetical protein
LINFSRKVMIYKNNLLFLSINRIEWQKSSKGSIDEIKNSSYDKSLYPTKSNNRRIFGRNPNNALLRYLWYDSIRNFLGYNLDGLVVLQRYYNQLGAWILLYSLLLSKTKTDFISDQT